MQIIRMLADKAKLQEDEILEYERKKQETGNLEEDIKVIQKQVNSTAQELMVGVLKLALETNGIYALGPNCSRGPRSSRSVAWSFTRVPIPPSLRSKRFRVVLY